MINQMKQSILCVDSDEEILVDLKQNLEIVGYRVFTSNDEKQGLEIIKNERPNVIISDQRIPSISESIFLQETRNILPDAMRILLTTQTDLDEIIDAINLGSIHKFILKPWQPDILLEMIQEGLQQQKPGIENRKLTLRLARQYKYLKETNVSLQDELKQTQGELGKIIEEMDKANEQDEIFDDEEATETQLLEKAKLRVKQLYDEVQNLRQATDEYKAIFETLNSIIEMSNPELYKHSNRVGTYCSWLAEALEFDQKDVADINQAAILHDIGKLEIDPEILEKPIEELSAAESIIYKQHPFLGRKLIRRIAGLREYGDIIQGHHEHYDGTGYPDGISGQPASASAPEIPIGSRLIAIASDYDNMLYSEVHGENLSHEDALKALKEGKSTLYDPELVDKFIEVMEDEETKEKLEQLNRPTRIARIEEVKSGMIAARDITTIRNGFLLKADTDIERKHLQSFKEYEKKGDPPVDICIYIG